MFLFIEAFILIKKNQTYFFEKQLFISMIQKITRNLRIAFKKLLVHISDFKLIPCIYQFVSVYSIDRFI